MYQIIKFFLFLFKPEKAHSIGVGMLHVLLNIPFGKFLVRSLYYWQTPSLEREVFGLKFKNPIGLAAGFDKNAKLIDSFSHLGFGFIEIGTVTPRPQEGNPKPRLFRLKKDFALLNRMGFNNEGVNSIVERLKRRKSKIIVGGNIGKNKSTPNEDAVDDYLTCFESLFPYVDYFAINVSSPNTPGLRELQEKEPLTNLLQLLKNKNELKPKPKPLLLKIAPDLSKFMLDDIISITKNLQLDGLIVSNTTVEKKGLLMSSEKLKKMGEGGISGAPIFDKSTHILKYIRKALPDTPLIGVGGISSQEDAIEKINAGATLLQVYTGLVYKGPSLIKNINKAIAQQT